MLYARRKRFSRLDAVIGKTFSFLPAHGWTLLSLAAAGVTGYLAVAGLFAAAAFSFAAAAAADKIDGAVARHRKSASPRGAYFDTIADRYSEAIVLCALLFVPLPLLLLPAYAWIFLLLTGSFMTTYAKAAAHEKMGKAVSGGIAERAERLVLLFAGLLLAAASTTYLVYVIALLAVLTHASALQRIYSAAGDN